MTGIRAAEQLLGCGQVRCELGNAAVAGMFLEDLHETSGNIWMTTLAPQ